MFLSELQPRMIQQQIMNRFKFLQSWFSMEEFPHDKLFHTYLEFRRKEKKKKMLFI